MHTPLKITTDNSLLKSLIKIDDLILFLMKNNIKACAIVDENLFGVLDFYLKCKKNNIKPLLGLSILLNNQEIYLYAKNYLGYQDLLKINTIINKRELGIIELEKFKSNLLIIVPFKSRELWSSLAFMENDLYLGYENLSEYTAALLISKNIVFVNDIRVLDVKDLRYLDYLDLMAERKKENYPSNYYYEIKDLDLGKITEIIDKIDINIPLDKKYIPTFQSNYDSFSFLKALSSEGLKKRLKGIITPIYQKRLNYELEVIYNMHFVDYFLIVYDYVLYAKKNKILVGCRGSAAGSLVSYAIGITDIDPVKYNLLFERFLNPERVTMPDIDIDFDALRREEVINYVKNKYGLDKVAKGLTFTTLKSKLVLRECAKILNINDILFNKFIKYIDADLTLKENYQNEYVQKYLNSYKELRNLYNVASKLEFLKRNVSTHAAGIVISSEKLENIIPIYENQDGLLTGITMDNLETIGLLKMDFLGLKNLNFIAEVTRNIPDLNLNNLNLEDPNVFQIFNSLDVDGIFQFETPLMKKFLNTYKINCFNDIIAAIALVRPGPKDHIDSYLRRKENKEKISYLDDSLEPILKETYGIILYQEQIMAILKKVANYSLAEADIVRRAISKKKEKIIEEEKEKFISRAIKNNYSVNVATLIYNDIAKFASYGFNKSHSVSYAYLAYQMAYLKRYYYEYFILEILKTASKEKIKDLIYGLQNKHFKIIKPSVNNLVNEFYIQDKKLYLPIYMINNINKEIGNKIMEVRNDKFTDYFDFLTKTKDFLKKDTLIKLIKANALACFNLNEETLINNIDLVMNYVSMADGTINKPNIQIYPDLTMDEKRKNELESYNMYISNHPSSKYRDVVKIENMLKWQFKKIKMAVIVNKITNIKTKNGDNMAFIEASDETGKADFTIFPENYAYMENIKVNDLILVIGLVSKRFDKYQIIVNNMKKVVMDNE